MQDNTNVFQITFDLYDEQVEKFEQIQTPTYYPTIEQLDFMREDPGKWLLFLCYISECGHKPRNKEEEYKKKNLTMFINEHLELVDDESEVKNPLPLYLEVQDEPEENMCEVI